MSPQMKILGCVKCGAFLLNKLPSWGLNGQHYFRRSTIKVGIFGVLTGAVTTAGYATYAYTVEEVDNNTKGLRECTAYVADNDAPTLKKFRSLLYSAAMSVPAKSIEMYLDFRRSVEKQVQVYTDPPQEKLLPDMHPREQEQHVLTLVLDLDETLIYSDWKAARRWRTFKRPGVDALLRHLSQFYEIVVYSDLPNEIVGPIIKSLDRLGCIRYSLSRQATKYQNGLFYRDLSKLNRDPSRIIYVSGHVLESCLQPENGIQIKAWKNNAADVDRALSDLVPFLEFVGLHRPHDVREVLSSCEGRDIVSEFNQHPEEFQRWKRDWKPADSRPVKGE